jgi:hypothetical protein
VTWFQAIQKDLQPHTREIMSGPENLRGVDYQISTSMLLILQALVDDPVSVASIRFDSLDNEGEDLALSFADGSVREIQIKKLAEGYNWTPASIRPILSKFAQGNGSRFEFITDGSASRQVQILGQYLAGNADIDHELQESVCGDELDLQALESLNGRAAIRSRFFPSPHGEDPAAHVREEVRKLLNRGSFSLAKSAEVAEAGLWLEVYAFARIGGEIALDQLLEAMRRCGVHVQTRAWASYPTARRYYEHEVPIGELVGLMREGGAILVTGIGGAGKTSLAAEAAVLTSDNRKVCWISVSELIEPTDVLRTIADYCSTIGLPEAAARTRAAEPVSVPGILLETLVRWPVAIVFDRFEAANDRVVAMLREALRVDPKGTAQGSIVVTSREIPTWWLDVRSMGTRHISLVSMPKQSANAILTDRGVGNDDNERELLMETVGRHAQSLVLLSQVIEDPADEPPMGNVAAREWVLRQVLSELPDIERIAIAKLAIFDYPAPLEFASAVLGEVAPDLIRRLHSRELVRVDAQHVSVHDALREAALGIISSKAQSELNRLVADEIFAQLARQDGTEDGILYEDAIRWAVHLERTDNLDGLSDRVPLILAAPADHLRDLFGVSYLGFPFEFEDPSLDTTIERLDALEEGGLIEENPANAGKEYLVEPAFILRDFSSFESVLIRALCFHHDYAGQTGYMNDMRPNFTYRQHGLYCPWEHCIELMPLPPMSKAEWLESREDDRRRLAASEASELDEGVLRILTERVNEDVPEWVVDEPDMQLRSRSCPVFGHACPAGEEQAQTCRRLGEFRWAVVPDGWDS